jgi:hypothetical protein
MQKLGRERSAQKVLEERTCNTKRLSSGEILMRYWVAGVEASYREWLGCSSLLRMRRSSTL